MKLVFLLAAGSMQNGYYRIHRPMLSRSGSVSVVRIFRDIIGNSIYCFRVKI